MSWATLDARASSAVRIVGDRLYAAWRTGDPKALANTAGDPKLLFKRGGAVDLMIATDPAADPKRRDPVAGDMRLLASMQNGKPMAVLYRAVVPGTRPEVAIPFISPVGKVSFDRVDNVSAQVELAQQGGDIELSFPLAALGLSYVSGETTLQGDIGILRGTGAITTQRLYWNDLNTSIATDIPSEARLQPGNWGLWKLSSDGVNDGSVALRPQNAKLMGQSIRLKKTGEGEGAEYSVGFWENPNASLQWQIEVPKAGKYRVELTYGNGGVANDFTFAAGEQKLAGKTVNTGGWETWRTVPIGEVTLPAGQSAFSLSPTPGLTGGLMDFKLLRLVPVM